MADIDVKLEAKTVKVGNDIYIHASVIPPVGTQRTPADICCVIDTSGSMYDEASVKNEKGEAESHGLSLLDIVKHAVATIIEALLPQDRLCLISFSNNANVILPLTKMDAAGKKAAHRELEALDSDGGTNFWDGVHTGLEMLRLNTAPGRLANLLVLTDGCPSKSPPGGDLEAMKQYKEEFKRNFPCAVTTFGFGYDVNTELLKSIADVGDGMYSFIPDSSFVGTIFVNSISNLLCTFAKNVRLSFETKEGFAVDKTLGFAPQTVDGNEYINLYSLQYDQRKDLLIKLLPNDDAITTNNLNGVVELKLRFNHWDKQEVLERKVENREVAGKEEEEEFVVQEMRFKVIELLKELMPLMAQEKRDEAMEKVKKLVEEIEKVGDAKVKGLLADLQGQVTEAISKPEWWQKWGKDYIPSLTGAHLLQQCNNFKDPGIQGYGGKLFIKIRDEVETIFSKLPPPRASRADIDQIEGRYNAPLANMDVYYNAYGGCFDANCKIMMNNHTEKFVKDVKKGDLLLTPNGDSAEVVCVMKMDCPAGQALLVEMEDGLIITPYHPIRINQIWKFPRDVIAPKLMSCQSVYTFLLSKNSQPIIFVNGIECVTLRHHLQDDVVRHNFFGTEEVEKEMQKLRGWDDGLIELPDMATCFVRDLETNMVCGFNRGSVLRPGV